MKKITLHRPKESFNKNCSYKILVGKKYLTDLKNGEEKTIEIPNEFNDEYLKAKILWCGSEKMELRNLTGDKKIVITGNKFLNKKMPLFGSIFPIIGLMFFNLKIVPKNVGIGIFIIFLLALLGTITFWRNKWLNIKTE
jgi:hypothetical protein